MEPFQDGPKTRRFRLDLTRRAGHPAALRSNPESTWRFRRLREWFADPDRSERYADAFDRYVRPLTSFCSGVPEDMSQRPLATLSQAREARSA